MGLAPIEQVRWQIRSRSGEAFSRSLADSLCREITLSIYYHCYPVNSLSLRDAYRDVSARAPKVGTLGDAWSSCREGRGEGVNGTAVIYYA